MVRQELGPARAHADLVGILGAAQAGGGHALADLHGLDRVDRHHRRRKVGVELAVDRRAEARRAAPDQHLDHRADAVLLLADAGQVVGPGGDRRCVGKEEVVAGDFLGVEARAVYFQLAHLHHVPRDRHLWRQFPQGRAGDAPSGDAGGGFAGAGSAAAAIVAVAVFQVIGDVGMAGAEGLGDLAIVARALVGVLDHQLDGGAGRPTLENAGQDADGIRLLPLRGHLRLAGAAAVEEGLDRGFVQGHAGGAAVHGGAERGAVAFAPGGDGEDAAEAVDAHAENPFATA